MKSVLQKRAEAVAERFKFQARSPVIIEFAGLPKAGKTTTLSQVQAFLKRCGFRVEVVIERASICPIRDKKHANFNVWTACTTLAQILEKTQTPPRPDDPEILILDRGLFDSICWLSVMERLVRIRNKERIEIEKFLLADDWCKRVSGVILMTADPKHALERERGYLLVEGAGGSIMNEEVLQQMGSVIMETAKRLKSHFRVFEINTSKPGYNGKKDKTCETAANKILDWIEDELNEEILYLPKKIVVEYFDMAASIDSQSANGLIVKFDSEGVFSSRENVEKDQAKIQALPVVIVRNKGGEILRLRRRERDENNALHEKIVIWAGGHVRKEDNQNGLAIKNCAIRELQEELRLRVEPDQLNLLGAVYSDISAGTSKHVALVYEWRAETDDVSIALSNSEFFERRGNSLSGTFVSADSLGKMLEKKNLTEEWSSQIIRNLLPDTAGSISPGLFD